MITIVTFSVTMFGMKSLLVAAMRVTSFVQKRTSKTSTRPRSRSTQAAANEGNNPERVNGTGDREEPEPESYRQVAVGSLFAI